MTSKRKQFRSREAAVNRREVLRDRKRQKKERKEMYKGAAKTLTSKRTSRKNTVAQRFDRVGSVNPGQRFFYEKLVACVNAKAPRLLDDPDYVNGLWNIASIQNKVNPLETWKPRGRSCNTLFKSLANHLLREYPIPQFLYAALLEEKMGVVAQLWVPLFAHAASGGSFYKAVKSGLFPFPLTKRMCHLFSTYPVRTGLIEAVRRSQIQAYGGEPSTLEAILQTDVGRRWLGGQEKFWATVMQWFCNHRMIDPNQVGPLFDYIGYRYREVRGVEGGEFSMKGRSPLALLRGMEEWHHELAVTKRIKASKFDPSGFIPQKWDRKVRNKKGPDHTEKWDIQEILTTKVLAAEGRAMSHCVYSYGHRVAAGNVSLWSLRCGKERRVTVEVDNQRAAIVQMAGPCNEAITKVEKGFLESWAAANNLAMRRVSRWR